jgi:hypothetical protein
MTTLSIGSSPLDLDWTVRPGLQSFALKFTGADLTDTVLTLTVQTVSGDKVFTAEVVGDTATWTIDEDFTFTHARCELAATTGTSAIVIAEGSVTVAP